MKRNPARATGATRSRTRSGCTTCRKRRVKCDEGKPKCQRCLSTGRVCDGYGIWGGGDTANNQSKSSRSFRTVSNTLLMYNLPVFSGISSQQEREAFNHFQRYMSAKVPGVFESGFWEKLVFQASAQDPAVLYSVIALAAGQMGNERLTLRAYNQAICELRQHLECHTAYALRVSLITCMVFICLELLRGSRNLGDLHLKNGLRLLKVLGARVRDLPVSSTHNIITLPQRVQTFDDCIIEAFTRLNVQSALFGQGSNYLYELGDDPRRGAFSYSMGSSFSTVGEARQHLDLLINGVLWLSSQADSLTIEGKKITNSLRSRRRRIQSALEDWMAAFQSSYSKESSTGDTRTKLGMSVLRVYHVMVKIMAATCLRGKDEMIYDLYTPDFTSLLQQVWELWTKATTTFGQNHHKFSFTADMGYITPLYYTSLKCRDPNIRRIAIDLLMKAPHIEGAWTGRLASAIAKQVMELEEGDIYNCHELVAGVMNPLEMRGGPLPPVPALARFNNVSVIPDAVVCHNTKVITTKYLGEGLARSSEYSIKDLDVEVAPQPVIQSVTACMYIG